MTGFFDSAILLWRLAVSRYRQFSDVDTVLLCLALPPPRADVASHLIRKTPNLALKGKLQERTFESSCTRTQAHRGPAPTQLPRSPQSTPDSQKVTRLLSERKTSTDIEAQNKIHIQIARFGAHGFSLCEKTFNSLVPKYRQ